MNKTHYTTSIFIFFILLISVLFIVPHFLGSVSARCCSDGTCATCVDEPRCCDCGETCYPGIGCTVSCDPCSTNCGFDPTPTPCQPDCAGKICEEDDGCGGSCPNNPGTCNCDSCDGPCCMGPCDGTDLCGTCTGTEDNSSSMQGCENEGPPHCGEDQGTDDCGDDCGKDSKEFFYGISAPVDGIRIVGNKVTITGYARDENVDVPSSSGPNVSGVDYVSFYRNTVAPENLAGTVETTNSNGDFSFEYTTVFPPGSSEVTDTIIVRATSLAGGCGSWDVGDRSVTFTNTPPSNGDLAFLNPNTGAVLCTNTGCDNKDTIANLAPNNISKVRIRTSFTDPDVSKDTTPGAVTDLKQVYLVFDVDTEFAVKRYYQLSVDVNSVNPTQSTVTEFDVNGYKDSISHTTTFTWNAGTKTLTMDTTLDLVNLGCDSYFLTNVMVIAKDYVDALSPYDTKTSNIDFWNGRCTQLDLYNTGYPPDDGFGNFYALLRISSPNCPYLPAGKALTYQQQAATLNGGYDYLNNSGTSLSIDLPYLHYGGTNACSLTLESVTEGVYLYASNFLNFAGIGSGASPLGRMTNYIAHAGSRDQNDNAYSHVASVTMENSDWPTIPSAQLQPNEDETGSVINCSPNCDTTLDIIKNVDDNGNFNQRVGIKVVVEDDESDTKPIGIPTNRYSDIELVQLIIQKKDDPNTVYAAAEFTDPQTGNAPTASAVYSREDLINSGFFINQDVTKSTKSTSYSLDMDLTKIPCGVKIPAQITVVAYDFSGQVGSETVLSDLTLWNGKCIKGNAMLNYSPPATGDNSATVKVTAPATCSYVPEGKAQSYGARGAAGYDYSLQYFSVTDLDLPYLHFQGQNSCPLTFSAVTQGNFFISSDFTDFNSSGRVMASSPGVGSNNVTLGGLQSGTSGVGDLYFEITNPNIPELTEAQFEPGIDCMAGECNGTLDVVQDIDDLEGYNQQVAFSFTVNDPQNYPLPAGVPPLRYSDIAYVRVAIEEKGNTDPSDFIAAIEYVDPENGSAPSASAVYDNQSIIASGFFMTSSSSISRESTSQDLSGRFVMDLSKIPRGVRFNAQFRVYAYDFGNQLVDEIPAGDVILWNGKDIAATYQHVPGGNSEKNATVKITVPESCEYDFTNPLDADFAATTRTTGSFILQPDHYKELFVPYSNYKGPSACVLKYESLTYGYYLTSADLTPIGGADPAATDGVIENQDALISNSSANPALLTFTNNAPVFPTADAFVLVDDGGGYDCAIGTSANTCVNWDFIENTDTPGDVNKKVRMTFSVTDPETANPFTYPQPDKFSDIETLEIKLHNTNDGWDLATITYTGTGTDRADPETPTITPGTEVYYTGDFADVFTVSKPVRDGDTISFQVVFDLSKIEIGRSWFTRVEATATDFAGASANVSFGSIDTWNGIIVSMQIAGSETESLTECPFTADALSMPASIIASSSLDSPIFALPGSVRVPYAFQPGGVDTPTDFSVAPLSNYFMHSSRFTSYTDIATCITPDSGGILQDIRVTRGGMQIGSGESRIYLSRFIDAWFQGINASSFVNSNMTIQGPTNRCSGVECYIMTGESEKQGIALIKGTIGGRIDKDKMGTPLNWYGENVGGAGTITGLQGFPTYNKLQTDFVNATADIKKTVTGNASNADLEDGKIIFVNGDLTLNADYFITTGALADQFMVVVVSGTITIGESVNNLDGIYIAQGGITIEDDEEPNYETGSFNDQLVVTGHLISGGTVTVSRTLGMANRNNPPVKVMNDPAQIIRFMNKAGLNRGLLNSSTPLGEY